MIEPRVFKKKLHSIKEISKVIRRRLRGPVGRAKITGVIKGTDKKVLIKKGTPPFLRRQFVKRGEEKGFCMCGVRLIRVMDGMWSEGIRENGRR